MLKLFTKYLDNQCSPEEVKALLAHFNASENETQLRTLILENLEKGNIADGEYKEATTEIYNRIKSQMNAEEYREEMKVIPFYKRTWVRIAAALVIILSVTAILLLPKKEEKQIAVAEKKTKYGDEIAPGGDKAILTLADGRKIVLDNAKNGTVADEGAAHVTKTDDGQIVYTTLGDNVKQAEVFYNTISIPRGGQYRLVLPDGSKVWLNSSSSIRFPNVFIGNDRKVEIAGEAYFEVTRDKAKPFKVSVISASGESKGEVEVLGTHFNINSYDNEEAVRTTLLEGAVKVKKGNNVMLLSPGQQARINNNGEIKLSKDVDIEAIMAWKEGKFIFTDDYIQSVMRQLERWYDIVVEYRGPITTEQFVASISRNVNISQMLNILEKSKAVKFEVRGRKVIVN